MTDEKRLLGTIPVDFEGETHPSFPLGKLSPELQKGRKRLTVKYLENNIYAMSMDRGLLYFCYKSWVHCPTVFIYDDETEVELHGLVISNNHLVNRGTANFYYGKILAKQYAYVGRVKRGYVYYTETKRRFTSRTKYGVLYLGDYLKLGEGGVDNKPQYWSNGASYNYIIPIHLKEGRIKLTVEVTDIIINKGEEARLTARVYRREHGNTIDVPEDIPSCGSITFAVHGETINDTPINISSNGFAQFTYTPDLKIGMYDIIATYNPHDTIKDTYDSMSGGGTLFIGDFPDKPDIILQNTPVILDKPVTKYAEATPLNFLADFSKCETETSLHGTVTLYLDNQEVTVYTTPTSQGTEYPVSNGSSTFSLRFNIGERPSAKQLWASMGYHNIRLVYHDTENDIHYFYYYPDIYIRAGVDITIIEEDGGLTPVEYRTHICYDDNDNLVTHTFTDADFIIGRYLRFLVTCKDDKTLPINEGALEVTLKSRDASYTENNKNGSKYTK